MAVADRDEPAFTPDEADALTRLLARIAHATMQLWATVAEPRLIANTGGQEARRAGSIRVRGVSKEIEIFKLMR